MKQFFRNHGFSLFLFVAIADLAGILMQNELIHFVTKPLLLPALFFTTLCSHSRFSKTWLLLAGLFFSFAGDVFLLFDSRYPLCFIFGLVCFLLTHLFYVFFFLNIASSKPSLFKTRPYLALIVPAYVAALLYLLLPHLGALKIPVVIYALVLGSMLLSSLHIFYKAGKPANIFFIYGALLFVVSDSLLAVNKFYHPLQYAGIFIMLTYCAAQYLIVKGTVRKD